MNKEEFLNALASAESAQKVSEQLMSFLSSQPHLKWLPVGGRANNRGIIEVSANTGRALVERVTNAIDAVLDAEYVRHDGKPPCDSPREAAEAWLQVPHEGLSALSPNQRRSLAKRVNVRLRKGDGPSKRIVDISDSGIGLSAEQFPTTILSLNESNKVTKKHLAGTYGQGGSATFASCEFSLLASRKQGSAQIAFTLVRYEPPPADAVKGGSYLYLVDELGSVLKSTADDALMERGTRCIHFGYDLTKYPSPLGPNSVYGLLQQVLFDPVLPVWFDNVVHDYRRVIKGSRNALHGAVDDGDDKDSKLSYSMPMFYVSLGNHGRAGIEYWVLEPPEKARSRPTASYVDPLKPIIVTLNGQNQAEIPSRLVRKDAELPYLVQRLICHIDCNSLTPAALRSLFSSNREDARRGEVFEALEKELIRVLRSDDDLTRLNQEARDQRHRQEDHETEQTMRKEVARLLKLQGFESVLDAGFAAGGESPGNKTGTKTRNRSAPKPIEMHEPPTYIKIVWGAEPIQFYPDQRRYIRVETDANSHYHHPTDPLRSGVNLIVTGNGFSLSGSTPLQGGRMRAVVTCDAKTSVGAKGELRVELRVPGKQTIFDTRPFLVVDAPAAKQSAQHIVMPPFKVLPVEGPDDEMWSTLGWPDDITRVASSAERDAEGLVVYYSKVFPNFLSHLNKLSSKDPTLSSSFEARYKIWLAVHSLILDKEQSEIADNPKLDEKEIEEIEYSERCRVATLAAMFAAAEVSNADRSDEE